MIVSQVNASFCQYRIVRGLESLEVLGIELMRAVAAVQLVFEVNANFGYNRFAVLFSSSNLYGGNKVFLPVSTDNTDWQLRSGKYYRLIEVLQHEAESGCREGHCIRPVQDHE